MVIRARKRIQAGKEIFIPYWDPAMPYQNRTKILSKHLPDGGCHCELCLADKRDEPDFYKRMQLLTNINLEGKLKKGPSSAFTEEIRIFTMSLHATYSLPRPLLRPDVTIPYFLIYEYLVLTRDYDRALRCLLLSLESAGIAIKRVESGKFSVGKIQIIEGPLDSSGRTIMMMLEIARFFKVLSKPELGNSWACAAFDAENIASGGGRALFFAKYKNALSELPDGMEEFMRKQK